MKKGSRLAGIGVWLLLAALPAMAGEAHEHGAAGHQHAAGLEQKMGEIRQHFADLVEKAYFTSVLRQLKAEEYRQLAADAGAIAGYAEQVRTAFSKGEKFERHARDLEKHAQKAAAAAGRSNLPEVNKEVGEMAEYCAKCHDGFRW